MVSERMKIYGIMPVLRSDLLMSWPHLISGCRLGHLWQHGAQCSCALWCFDWWTHCERQLHGCAEVSLPCWCYLHPNFAALLRKKRFEACARNSLKVTTVICQASRLSHHRPRGSLTTKSHLISSISFWAISSFPDSNLRNVWGVLQQLSAE